jgi:hypothetical protein
MTRRKLLLPVTEGALVDAEHLGYFLDGVVQLQVLVQVQCHNILILLAKVRKKNGLTKYQPVFCNFFQKIWKVQKLSLILQPVKC